MVKPTQNTVSLNVDIASQLKTLIQKEVIKMFSKENSAIISFVDILNFWCHLMSENVKLNFAWEDLFDYREKKTLNEK